MSSAKASATDGAPPLAETGTPPHPPLTARDQDDVANRCDGDGSADLHMTSTDG